MQLPALRPGQTQRQCVQHALPDFATGSRIVPARGALYTSHDHVAAVSTRRATRDQHALGLSRRTEHVTACRTSGVRTSGVRPTQCDLASSLQSLLPPSPPPTSSSSADAKLGSCGGLLACTLLGTSPPAFFLRRPLGLGGFFLLPPSPTAAALSRGPIGTAPVCPLSAPL